MEPTFAQSSESGAPGLHTWDDFLALDEDDPRELIDGQLTEVEVPTALHEYIIMTLGILIGSWARARKAGVTLGSGYKVQINRKSGVMPDLQFFRTGRLPRDAQQALTAGHPDLAVEVISPSSRSVDRVMKLNAYARIGVPEYWLIDPEARVLERLLLREGRYIVEPHGPAELFRPDSFPELEIPLAELWEIPGGEPPTA